MILTIEKIQNKILEGRLNSSEFIFTSDSMLLNAIEIINQYNTEPNPFIKESLKTGVNSAKNYINEYKAKEIKKVDEIVNSNNVVEVIEDISLVENLSTGTDKVIVVDNIVKKELMDSPVDSNIQLVEEPENINLKINNESILGPSRASPATTTTSSWSAPA